MLGIPTGTTQHSAWKLLGNRGNWPEPNNANMGTNVGRIRITDNCDAFRLFAGYFSNEPHRLLRNEVHRRSVFKLSSLISLWDGYAIVDANSGHIKIPNSYNLQTVFVSIVMILDPVWLPLYPRSTQAEWYVDTVAIPRTLLWIEFYESWVLPPPRNIEDGSLKADLQCHFFQDGVVAVVNTGCTI